MKRQLAFLCLMGVSLCEVCTPLEVLFLQETTADWRSNLTAVIEQLPPLLNTMQLKYKVSRFGVAESRDKPIAPFGDAKDFCYRLGDFGPLSKKRSDVMYAYNRLYSAATEQGDQPNAQLQAVIDANSDLRVGWKPHSRRLIILVTKTAPHLPTDASSSSKTANTGRATTFTSGEDDPVCASEDYPSFDAVYKNLSATKTKLIILGPDVTIWKDGNAALKQNVNFFQPLDNECTNFFSAALRGLEAYESEETCSPPAEETTTSAVSAETMIITGGADQDGALSRPYNAAGGARMFIKQLQKRVILTVDN